MYDILINMEAWHSIDDKPKPQGDGITNCSSSRFSFSCGVTKYTHMGVCMRINIYWSLRNPFYCSHYWVIWFVIYIPLKYKPMCIKSKNGAYDLIKHIGLV